MAIRKINSRSIEDGGVASADFGGSVTSLSNSGNLTFTGTGNRIAGDFSNGTIANRVAFQSSTTNGNTDINVLPNGTASQSQISVQNNSDPTNAGRFTFLITSTEATVRSNISGTGTYLPLTLYTNNAERLRIDTSGNLGIGTSSPAMRLDVTGGGIKIGYQGAPTWTTDSFLWSESGVGLNIDGFNLKFNTGNTRNERMRIFSDGRVSVNANATYDAGTTMTLGGGSTNVRSTSAQLAITRATVSTQYEGINFNTGPSRACFIGRPPNSDDLIIGWDAGSALVEGLRFPSPGGGIKFPATQVASADANTLDDYEEGTWTPIMTSENGSITSYTSSGTYTKIGNIVTVTGYTVLTTVGTAGGRAFIASFPFAGTSSTDFIQPGCISREAQATGYIYFAYINGGNTNGVIQNSTSGAIAWVNGYRYSWTITYKC